MRSRAPRSGIAQVGAAVAVSLAVAAWCAAPAVEAAPHSRPFWTSLFTYPSRAGWFLPVWTLALAVAVVFGVVWRRRAADEATRSRWRVVSIALAALPLAWCLAFGCELLAARVVTGVWPYPSHGGFLDHVASPIDPKRLGPIHAVTMLGMPFALSATYWFPLLAAGAWARRRAAPWPELAVFGAGYSLLGWLWYSDPGSFLEWWFD